MNELICTSARDGMVSLAVIGEERIIGLGKRHHSNERQIITPYSAVEEIDLSSWGINTKPRALLIG